jgi:hypothetical protein
MNCPMIALGSCETVVPGACLRPQKMTQTPASGLSVEPIDTSRAVMRAFLRNIGWHPSECLSLDATVASAWEREPEVEIARWRSMGSEACASPAAAEVLMADALLLDVRKAPAAQLREALPPWLLRQSPGSALLLARAIRREGHAEEAIAMLQGTLRQNDAIGAAHGELGVLLRARGRTNEAATAFESSLATRRRIAFDGRWSTRLPVLVAQPRDAIDIIMYENRFYVLPRDPDCVGARAIAGELFEIRRNRWYRVARRAVRLPLSGRLIALARAVLGSGAVPSGNTAAYRLPRIVAVGARLARAVLRRTARKTATALFARPIAQRADTLMEAIVLADQAALAHHPARR